MPVESGLARVERRGAHDRLESERVSFHERVRAGYDALRAEEPYAVAARSTATQPEEIVADALWQALHARGLVRGGRSWAR